jgi:hypothetical protein
MKGNIFLGFTMVCVIALLSGSCRRDCPLWYSGNSCTPVNQKFTGAYAGGNIITADGNSNPAVPDTITISAGTGPDTILINNVSSPIKGAVAADGNSFSVPSQTVAYRGVPIVIVSGTGTLAGDSLKALFSGTSGGLPFTIAYTGVRE